MKHSNFENELNEIRRRAVNELKEAIAAHNGRYDFTQYDIVPLVNGEKVCEAGLYEGNIFIDTEDCFLAATEISIDGILTLTDYIAETDEVKDVSGVYPVPVTWVDRDDIEMQGYDTSEVTQETLDNIANHMGGSYLNYSFSEDLDNACKSYGLKEKEG